MNVVATNKLSPKQVLTNLSPFHRTKLMDGLAEIYRSQSIEPAGASTAAEAW